MTVSFKTYGHGENIVLLHGWAMNSNIWLRLLPQLTQKYRVTLVDLNNYDSPDKITEEIIAIAPPKAIWLGWSLGGLIALNIALQQPAIVSKLILVSSSPCFVAKNNWPGIDHKIFTKFCTALSEDVLNTVSHFLTLQLFPAPKNALQQHLSYLKTIIHNKPLPEIKTLFCGLEILQHTDLRSQLTNINCPVLFILGELDTLVKSSIKDILPHYSSHIATTVVANATHIPFLTQPKIFWQVLTRFLHVQ
jgi:pimeloyl-[acyl-carrier protein] methyl ester esterase